MRQAILILLLVLCGCGDVSQSQTPREKYFTGDRVRLSIGIEGVVRNKTFRVRGGKKSEWSYFILYKNNLGEVLPMDVWENEIELLTLPSPTRPQAEASR